MILFQFMEIADIMGVSHMREGFTYEKNEKNVFCQETRNYCVGVMFCVSHAINGFGG